MKDDLGQYADPDKELRFVGLYCVASNGHGSEIREFLVAQQDEIKPEWLFYDRKNAAICTAAIELAKAGLNPTPSHLADQLRANSQAGLFGGIKGNTEIEARLTAIQKSAAEASGGHWELNWAMWALSNLKLAASERALIEAGHVVSQTLGSGRGTLSQRYAQAMDVLRNSSPESAHVAVMNGSEMAKDYIASILPDRAAELVAGGKPITFPPQTGLHKMVPQLRVGDATLLMARFGTGKTGFAAATAEWAARSGHQVLWFGVENAKDDTMDRWTAGWTGIKIEDLWAGSQDPRIQAAIDERPWLDRITYTYCPGVTIAAMCDTITSFAHRLQKWQKLVVIVDYLDINYLSSEGLEGDNTAYKLASAANRLRTTVGICTDHPQWGFSGGVHGVILQQQNDQGLAFGSRGMMFYGQVIIQLQRKNQRKGQSWGGDFYEAGEMSPLCRLKVVKANKARPGVSYALWKGQEFRFVQPAKEDGQPYTNSEMAEWWKGLDELETETNRRR